MYWIIIVIIAAILSIREGRKEKEHPGYRSWMSDNSQAKDQWWWW